MNKKSLYNLGGISAFIVAFLIGALDLSTILAVNLGNAFIPTFSILICFYLVFLLAGVELVAETNLALARIGGAFGAMLVVTLFMEVAVLGADRILLLNDSSIDPLSMSEMDALFTSTHSLAVWFHAIWMACWGLALFHGSKDQKTIGTLMLVFAVIYLVYYWFNRLGNYEIAEIVHMIAHVPLLVSHFLIGRVLISARETKNKIKEMR